MSEIDCAAAAIADGDVVVYPTETVYGLGANALDADAVERVFETKGRPRDNPVSLGVPDVTTAREYTRPTDRELAFMEAFLPGPVTVVVECGEDVPTVVTAGGDRVGVRVPADGLAREFFQRAGVPVTATSANESGAGSVRDVSELSERVRGDARIILDGGETPGTESTVVDVEAGTIHRRGAQADAIEAWLAEH